MSNLIKKYKPSKEIKNFDPTNITKDGIKEIGLEKIAKDIYNLSN